MLLREFTDDCRAEGACVVATCVDKVITITRVSLPTGEAGGQREWEVVKRVATATFGKCTSVAGKLGSHIANWSKFKVEVPPTAMLLREFTDDCRAEGACVVATCDDKVITITRVSLPTGEAGGQREWEVVKRVAATTFGKCTSSAGAANYAESKSNPAMSTNEAKSAGASKGVQPKGKGSQKCGMCGQVGVNSTTCPRNRYAVKPIHEDGRKEPRTRNGHKQRGGDGKHLYADYLD
jgi:ferredoxin